MIFLLLGKHNDYLTFLMTPLFVPMQEKEAKCFILPNQIKELPNNVERVVSRISAGQQRR